MGLLDKIKSDAKKSGSNKAKIFYVREGEKKRIRFLDDMDEGLEIVFHDSYEAGINQPCGETFGRDCELCESEDVRTRSLYAWSVWDYDAAEVKVFLFAINNCSPLPVLVALFDNYGTITDRDYVVSTTGKQQNKSYSVIPMDKNKFRNEKAKPLTKKALLQILDKAFPSENSSDDEEEEKKPKKSKNTKDEDCDYDDMTAKELYNLCKERDIEVATKKPEKYYIAKLEEFDEENSEEDDWEDDDDDFSSYEDMTAKELYTLCKEKKIEVKPKKSERYYINLLEEFDKAEDDWGDEDAEEKDW